MIKKTRLLAISLVVLCVAVPGRTQVIDDVEDLRWDRPEAWAMKYFNSVSILTGLGPPRDREAWTFQLGLELDTIPHLSHDQRRVGFGGAKVEDLNRLPVFFRPRLTIGLPARWSLDIAYVPPVEIEGVQSHLFAVAGERMLYSFGPWSLGARLYGQIGRVDSDFTCTAEESTSPPGSDENFWGCERASKDEVKLSYLGAAFTGGFHLRATDFHWGLAATYMDMEFQVDALTFGVHDRTLLRADGWTWSVTGGAGWALGDRLGLAVELFFSPLSVVRPPSTAVENDPLLNLRTILRINL